MSTETSKSLFEFFARAYRDTNERVAFNYPSWITQLKSNAPAARVAHVCLQSALASMMARPGWGGRIAGLDFDEEVTPVHYLKALEAVRKMNPSGADEVMAPILSGLREYLGFTGDIKGTDRIDGVDGGSGVLHGLATEAAGRNAAAVTPVDVVNYMLDLSQSAQVHTYALDGLGLLYGLDEQHRRAWSVGDEFQSEQAIVWPNSLEKTLEEAWMWFKAPEFSNRAFLEIETLVAAEKKPAAALLVNAARQDLPFYPADTKEDDLPTNAGLLNRCLTAGYQKVVVLVSNHYLTAGRGRAELILRHCLQHGLRRVIQLPMGVLGLRSQAHSILVFEPGANVDAVAFENLMDEALTTTAAKGFGLPRRARQFDRGNAVRSSQIHSASVQTLLNRRPGSGKARKILSFEVGQFSPLDAIAPVRERYEFMRLGSFMDVFRSHHVVETGDEKRSHYSEIGAGNISADGWVSLGKMKDCPTDSLERRQAQILRNGDLIMCFRGSPDSYAKVGIYRHQTGVQAVPNQSFVIIRRKQDAPDNAPSPELVLWWLQSQYGQNYLQQKAIAPDVIRVAPRDIDALDVPCGPPALIEEEEKRLFRAQQASQRINELRTEVAALLEKAWQQ